MLVTPWSRRRGQHQERGAVAVIVAILAAVLLGFAAFAVDISRWYVEMQRLQKTVDAAALAAAPYMPEVLTGSDKASTAAKDLVARNGYDPSTATIEQGDRPTQVRVTLSSTVDNGFADVFTVINPSSDFDTTTLTRTAVADFSGPAPLGSPCNVHGNEPWDTKSTSGSVLPSPLPSNCSNYPQFWSTIVGPEVYKTQGDRFAPRKCGVDPYQESGCATPGRGGANAEFDPRGYVITIKVAQDLTGPLNVQLYDPAYVDTGSRCDALPAISGDTLGTNTYTDNASERYRNDPNPIGSGKPSYCTGDNDNNGLRFGSEVPTVTSFGLIKPTDTYNPFDSRANEPANRICAMQFPGFSKSGGGNNSWTSTQAGAAPGGNATEQLSQNSELTRLFHQWVPLCTIPGPVKAGDYYLRVRTNVAAGDAQAVFTQPGDNASVVSNGSNRFAVRAIPTSSSDANKIAVSPFTRMPIFANSNGSQATFNLIRVLPGNAGQSIDFSFYDVGDAAGNGTLSVLPPTDSNVAAATNCTKEGKENGADPDCSISGIRNSNGWNGQAQRMRIPIPTDYTCDFTSPFGCWWRLNVNFGGGVQVTDQTTWTAVLDGDPVRLVE
jgi:Flp pilus assembly protein TadG